MTSTLLVIIFFNFFAALSDLVCWVNEIIAETNSVNIIKINVAKSFFAGIIISVNSVTIATIINTILNGFIKASFKLWRIVLLFFNCIAFLPYSSNLSSTSTILIPSFVVLYSTYKFWIFEELAFFSFTSMAFCFWIASVFLIFIFTSIFLNFNSHLFY